MHGYSMRQSVCFKVLIQLQDCEFLEYSVIVVLLNSSHAWVQYETISLFYGIDSVARL